MTLTTDKTVDEFEAYYYRKEILKKSLSGSSQNPYEKIFGYFEGESNFNIDSSSCLYKSEIKKANNKSCDPIFIEVNSSTDAKQYSKVSTLTAKIEQFRNYGDEIFDPDIPVAPNSLAIDTAKDLVIDLVENDIAPFRVAPSIDEGLCLAFSSDDILAYLELYNDGEIGLIAENIETKEMITNKDLLPGEIIAALLELFQ